MIKSTFSKGLFLIILIFSLSSYGANCEGYKNAFLLNNTFNEADLKNYQHEVKNGHDLCLMNLLGIMLYKGIYLEKDTDRAEKIFFDLSNQGYPEASFNFALLMTKKTDQNPENVLALLLGIYNKYAKDDSSSHLATKARETARLYIENLPSLVSQCQKGTSTFCSNEISALKASDIANLSARFDLSVRDLQASVALDSLNQTRLAKEKVDNIMSLLSLGLIAYNLSNIGASSNSHRPTAETKSNNPWFNYGQGFKNPLGLYQFQLH